MYMLFNVLLPSVVLHSADLKPENLMLSSWDEEKAEVKLVDFGCSLIVSNKETTEDDGQSYPSTVAYDPPEKIINRSAPNFKSDVWAAGCILYIILTGSHVSIHHNMWFCCV